jgi:hypothetical protein
MDEEIQPRVSRGVITTAPTSVTDGLEVATIDYAESLPYQVQPGAWTPKGSTLPEIGATCIVCIDHRDDAWVTGWLGDQDFTAGGDLGGTFPNPEVMTVLGGQTPVTTEDATGWITPTLINSWASAGAGTPQYMRDALGFVHFKGSLTGGTSNTNAFVLPPGFRVPTPTNVPIAGSTGSNSLYLDYLGNFEPVFTASGDTIFLSGISPYLAEA